MPGDDHVAHSIAEAYLYLMVATCEECGRGPLEGADAEPGDRSETSVTLSIPLTCRTCGAKSSMSFVVPVGLSRHDPQEPTVINPTKECSRLIDVAQWLTLFRVIVEVAEKERDKQQARHLGLEAAQCLEEALKFYDDPDNDLPPEEAFFHKTSRQRFHEHPEQFSRRRIIDLRAKLPTLSAMRSTVSSKKKHKRWPWRS